MNIPHNNRCRRNDRHFSCSRIESDVIFVEIAHHASGSIQPKGRAARQHDSMDFFNKIYRVE